MSNTKKELLVSCQIRGIHLSLLAKPTIQTATCTSTQRKAIRELHAWGLLHGRGTYQSPQADLIAAILQQRPNLPGMLASKYAFPLLNGLRGTHEHTGCSDTTFRKLRLELHKAGLIKKNPWRVVDWLQPLLNWYVQINQGAGFLIYTCGQEMAWRADTPSSTTLHGPGVRVQSHRTLTQDEELLLQARADALVPAGIWLEKLNSRVKPLLTSQPPYQLYQVREPDATA